MVFSGLKFMGKVPFKDVVIHGMVRDKNGVKMSKHLGNGIDPIDMIDKYGADALRLSIVSGMSMGTDIKYGEDKIKETKIFINKLYNASKFVISNLKEFKVQPLKTLKLQEKDKWILSELNELIKSVDKNMERYALGVCASNLIEFTVSKFCDWYIELAKVDLYGGDEKQKHTTQNVLYYVFDKLLKLFHPFIPFVTEYIYQNMPEHEETIMLCNYPEKIKLSLTNDFESVIALIKEIRNARAKYNLPDNKKTSLLFKLSSNDNIIKENLNSICKLAFGSEAVIVEKQPEEKCIKLLAKDSQVFIPLGQLIDSEKENEKQKQEIEKLMFEINRSEKMLANKGFIEKAPKALIENEKQKLEKNKALLKKIQGE